MKKNLLSLLTMLLLALPTLACPVCQKSQPKGFANITHGVGPGGPFDYFMLYGSIAVVVLTFGLFFRHLFRPDNPVNRARRELLTFN